MSTELKPVKDRFGEVYLTQFAGGRGEGVCVQLTPEPRHEYISLTKEQARDLGTRLIEFADTAPYNRVKFTQWFTDNLNTLSLRDQIITLIKLGKRNRQQFSDVCESVWFCNWAIANGDFMMSKECDTLIKLYSGGDVCLKK